MVADILHTIRTVDDIGRLFANLGYTQADLPFLSHTRTVARWKGFKVVAAERSDARAGAREVSHEISKTPAVALAAVLSPDRQLVLASPRFGQAGITRLLVITLDAPSRFAKQQLERLRPCRSATALGHALSVAEILSSEEVGEQFFAAFKMNLDKMVASIDSRRGEEDGRMAVLLALSRILFLCFVQAKGWLDRNPDYLKQRLDWTVALRRNFHRSVLNPLFFGTLNQPPERRSKKVQLGDIPYLNGGLFEPHAAERRMGMPRFTNQIWCEVFDGLFERFRFSVREDDEVDAIAPDMLGRVFERLMNSGERHKTGTYYTPESVVRQVVTATLETALTGDLPPEVVRQLLSESGIDKPYMRRAGVALRKIRVLDPAVGSGAFLLAVLDELTRMRVALETNQSSGARLRLRKQILHENLMGIDLNPIAVKLAELRLWLAVVADDPTTEIERVVPLPNLDGVVRQGDSLLDPIGAACCYCHSAAGLSLGVAVAVSEARQALFAASGDQHSAGASQLRQVELHHARKLINSAIKSTTDAAEDLKAAAESSDLFGKRGGLTEVQRERLQKLQRIRRDLVEANQRLSDGVLPFFSFEVHAPDILAQGGFTAVVGNPPWVRSEQLPRRQREVLAQRFQWWRSNGDSGFAHLPDLSVAFLERCLELTRNGGAIGLLLPSKLTSAGYGERARRGLVRETSIEYVHRVPDREASRFGATTYPLAIVLRKEPAPPDHCVQLGFDKKVTLYQQSLDVGGPWILHPARSREALDEFCSAGAPLGDSALVTLGVKTGADALFVGQVVGGNAKVAEVAFADGRAKIETLLLRPALRGRDVRKFRLRPTKVIIWCNDEAGAPLQELPKHAYKHLMQFARNLRGRTDYRNGPLWTVFRTRSLSGEHRMVWPDIARHPRAVVLAETQMSLAIPLNSCYVAATPDRETALAAAAVMNSTWASALFTARSDEARGGFRRINARAVRLLPIPNPGTRRSELAWLSKQFHGNDGYRIEDLDEAVSNAFCLSSRTQDALRKLAKASR